MAERPSYVDLKVSDYEIGVSRLIGKVIEDVHGYVSEERGEPFFKLTKVAFTDGTFLSIEGEHDFPYLVTYGRETQPHFDEETLQQLINEAREERLA